MKTALRTYHPVPALQTEEIGRKEMQDAPRIKAMLKACYLAGETHNNQPVCLKDIAKKAASMGENDGPPTTAPNVLFQMFNEATVRSYLSLPACDAATDIPPRRRSGSVRSTSRLALTFTTSSTPLCEF